MSLHFDHSVHGGHGLVWVLSVSPRVCDRTTGHISTGASWPGVALQEETQKSAPLLPSANLPFTGPGTQAQPKACLAVVCPQDKWSGGKAPGCRGHLPLSQKPPCHFVSADQQPWQQGCVTLPFTQRADKGSWLLGTPRSSTYLPIQRGDGSDMERRNVGLLQRCRQPLVPWIKHLMAQGGLP